VPEGVPDDRYRCDQHHANGSCGGRSVHFIRSPGGRRGAISTTLDDVTYDRSKTDISHHDSYEEWVREGAMATLHAVMFGIALALTPSLVTLAFFLYRDWMLTRDEHPDDLEPYNWSLHC
jgi:hypothetical protein